MKQNTIGRTLRLLAAAALMLALSSACKSHQMLDGPGMMHEYSEAAKYAQRVMENTPNTQTLTAKTKVNLSIGTKRVSLSGSLKMRRGDVIQLSLTFPIVGEVCRMEFSPAGVLVIDRINTRYVEATYEDVDFLRSANLDYNVLESIFWNELFYPGSSSVQYFLDDFTLSSAGTHTLLSLTTAPKLDYSFLTLTESALIDRLTVSSKNQGSSSNLVCAYGDFAKFEGGRFPTHLQLTFAGDKSTYGLDITLSSLSPGSDWQGHTQPSAKYERIEADKLFKNLIP